MRELDRKRLEKMTQRGGLPAVDELVAMWRLTGGITFKVPNDRQVVNEARRRIREAGKRLGKTEVSTLHHKGSGRIFGIMEYTPEEQAAQDKRLREAMASMYPKS